MDVQEKKRLNQEVLVSESIHSAHLKSQLLEVMARIEPEKWKGLELLSPHAIHVDYSCLSDAELQKEFSEVRLYPVELGFEYDDGDGTFDEFVCKQKQGMCRLEPVGRCKEISRRAHEVIFVPTIASGLTTEEILKEFEAEGLRPAVYEELVAFARKIDRHTECLIIALGSGLLFEGRAFWPSFFQWVGNARLLSLNEERGQRWNVGLGDDSVHFLAVKK